jgi:hypothetical protein
MLPVDWRPPRGDPRFVNGSSRQPAIDANDPMLQFNGGSAWRRQVRCRRGRQRSALRCRSLRRRHLAGATRAEVEARECGGVTTDGIMIRR